MHYDKRHRICEIDLNFTSKQMATGPVLSYVNSVKNFTLYIPWIMIQLLQYDQ